MYNAHRPPIRPEPPQQPSTRKKAHVVAFLAVALGVVLFGLALGIDPLFWLAVVLVAWYKFFKWAHL